MLNGINLNNKDTMSISSVVTNPISNPYRNADKSLLIDESAISQQAVNLYQKEQDIKQFTLLAMSNPEDLSHEKIISSLFQKGVIDPFSDEAITALSNNDKLLKDITL